MLKFGSVLLGLIFLITLESSSVGQHSLKPKALSSYDSECLAFVPDSLSKPLANNYRAFFYACSQGNIQQAKLLLQDDRLEPNYYNNLAFRTACAHGKSEMINFLLSLPQVDPADKSSEALKLAVSNDHVEVVKLLLSLPNIMIESAFESNNPTVKRLLGPINIELMKACKKGNYSRIQEASNNLEMDDLNQEQINLLIMCSRPHKQIAEFLRVYREEILGSGITSKSTTYNDDSPYLMFTDDAQTNDAPKKPAFNARYNCCCFCCSLNILFKYFDESN